MQAPVVSAGGWTLTLDLRMTRRMFYHRGSASVRHCSSVTDEAKKVFVRLTPGRDLQGGGGVGLAALVPGDDLDLSGVDVAALGDVEVPHAVVDQLVLDSLLRFYKNLLSHPVPCVTISEGFLLWHGKLECFDLAW